MTLDQQTTSALTLNYFKLNKKIKELREEQDEIKEEMKKRWQKEKFEKVETLLGSVVPMSKITYKYEDPELAEKDSAIELKISHQKKETKALAESLKEVRKEAEKIRVFGNNPVLRFTGNN